MVWEISKVGEVTWLTLGFVKDISKTDTNIEYDMYEEMEMYMLPIEQDSTTTFQNTRHLTKVRENMDETKYTMRKSVQKRPCTMN